MSAPARIGEHGVIGDMRTAALVAQTGEIDSMCFPFFDSPPIFDRLIDPIDGGAFQIVCNIDDAVSHQLYLPNTNVLITRALGSGGILEITDFMALGEDVPQCLVRRVAVVRGEVEVHIRCRPRFDYGRVGHDVAVDGHAVHFAPADHGEGIRLCCPTADWTGKDGAAEATLRLRQGERADLVLSRLRDEHADLPLRGDRLDRVFHRTVEAWRRWVARSRYTGRWREEVSRSGLLLKLLTSKANGSLVAAPTFGLPEAIGGQRNWDYRFTWVRDASLGLLEFLALGHTEEAAAFVTWLTERCAHAGEEGRLEPMYRLNGGAVPDEQSLEHYEGYRGSRPVRIGNGAAGQLQLDTYGELFLALDRYDAATAAITHDDWRYLRSLVAWLRDNWSREDK
ncbi:MAG: glycoside hydrolase family 15 protein, partial [Sandaracinaceae bacterium]